MSDDQDFMLTDEQGAPVGMLNLVVVKARGDQLAFDLAAVCDQPGRIGELIRAAMESVGAREFGYVAQGALLTVLDDIVRPLMLAAEAAGAPVRDCFETEAARGAGTACAVCGHRTHALLELFGFQVQHGVTTRTEDQRDGAL